VFVPLKAMELFMTFSKQFIYRLFVRCNAGNPTVNNQFLLLLLTPPILQFFFNTKNIFFCTYTDKKSFKYLN